MLYISDLVDSVKKIISTKDKNPFYLFNIGSGKAISIKDLACKIVEIAGVKDKKIFITGFPLPKENIGGPNRSLLTKDLEFVE